MEVGADRLIEFDLIPKSSKKRRAIATAAAPISSETMVRDKRGRYAFE